MSQCAMIVSTDAADYGHAQVLGFTDEQAPRRPYAAIIIQHKDAWPDVARKLRELADAIEKEHCSLREPPVFDNTSDAMLRALTHGEGWAQVKAP